MSSFEEQELSRRNRGRLKYIASHAISEVIAAQESGEISITMAETIAHLPPEMQSGAFKTRAMPAKRKEETEEPVKIERTGYRQKPEESIPQNLLREVITPDMLVRGFGVVSDSAGEPCVLPVGVSKLERDESVATMIGGSQAFKDRKAFAKWEKYHKKKIRVKILRILEELSPLEIPAGHKVPAVNYDYNLGIASDLQELADMIHADLSRQAQMLAVREKYEHLISGAPVKAL